MPPDSLIASWKDEEKQPFSGWDFSHLNGRMFEEPPPWSYATRAAEVLRGARAALDMGTGGGERLLELRLAWPKRMAATEEYPPNFKLAGERLGPFGVEVRSVKLTRTGPMPYAAGEFDVVLNRHSAFNSREVARILAPGGTFLTQQVDGHFAEDLEAVFGAKPQWSDGTLANSLTWLNAAGFEILAARNWAGRLIFSDVGTIVYYLRAVPWLVPGFEVDRHLPGLLQLQAQLERGEPLSFQGGKFLIEAKIA